MKRSILIFGIIILSLTSCSHSQTFKSSKVSSPKKYFATEIKDRVITISDKEISITNFLDRSTKTWRLIVNNIENVEWKDDGVRKTYFCTDADKDVISGTYGKAVAYKTKHHTFIIESNLAGITAFTYEFSLE
jgi:hypothetical protein